MPMISKNKVDYDVLEKLFSLFFEIIGKRRNQQEFRKILFDILSSTERIMISKRIAIIYLLTKNIDYRIICEVLKVSAATVFKYRLKIEESKGIVPLLKKILLHENIENFFKEIIMDLYGPGTPGVDWGQARINRIKFEQKKETGL